MKKWYRKGQLYKRGKRSLALLLSACLIGTMIPVTARAESGSTNTGLCEHHTEHTVECGYEESSEGSSCTYVCEICAEETKQDENTGSDEKLTKQTTGKFITAWQWVDEKECLDEETGNLALPGASEQMPAYFEDVTEFLPTQIQATVENAEDTENPQTGVAETITLGDWTCEEYPKEGAYSGSYIFTASLPEGYTLSGEAETLTVLVELGGAQMYETVTSISYLDGNGITKTCASATKVTSEDASWGTSDTETWYVVKDTVTISSRVTVNGNVHLILSDDCSLTVNGGIEVNKGSDDTTTNTLSIYGQTEGNGYLYANAKDVEYAPGIGAKTKYKINSGKITINGGTIQATGGRGAAGIGSAALATSEIIINGGTITAYGGQGGAGIGGGFGASAGSTITINGGSITAYGGNAYDINGAAGIGGGESDSGGTIIINGGTIYSQGGNASKNAAAGIGAGGGNDDGELTINGGTITAIGGELSGYNGNDGDGVHIKKLHITNGNLTATGYYGIYFAESTTITENSSVNVTGATAIYGASGATFSVNNGSTVTAYARTMYGIWCNGSITISNSTVTAVGEKQGIKSGTAVNITDNSNVFANGIEPKDNSSEWNGFIVSKNVEAGKLAFDNPQQVLNGDYTIAGTLLIPDGTILTNKGTLNADIIEVAGSGQLVNEGTLNANKIIMPTTGEVCNKAGGTMNVQLIEYQQEFGKLTNSGDMYVKTLNAAYILNGTMTNDGRIFIGGGFSRANEVLGNGGIYYQLTLESCFVVEEGTDSDALIPISVENGKYYAKWGSKIQLKPDWNDNQFFKEWYAPNVFIDDESYDDEDMTIQKTNIFTMPNWPATITAKYSTLSIADITVEYGPYATNRYPLVVSGIYDGSGMGTVTYNWYKGQDTNGEPLEETRGSYTTPVNLEVGEHYYTCEIVCNGGENRRNTVTLTAKVTVVQAQGKVSITTDSLDKTYDGQGVAAPEYEVQGDGAVTVEYAKKNESNFSTTVPVDAGEYVVRVSMAETNHYKAATDKLDFTISPAPMNIVGLTATDRAYEEGNKTITLTGGTLAGIVSGDEDKVTAQMPISGTIEDENVGNGKIVTYSTTLTGEKANNYTLTLPTVTVNIFKAESSVGTAPSAKTGLIYDGNAQALVNEGTAAMGGTMMYSTSQNGEYSTNIPTGTDAKEYSIWYKVVGDANHTDVEPDEIKVSIAPLEITNENTTITPGADLTYTGEEQTQSIESVKVGDMTLVAKDYVVTGNKRTDAGLYTLIVNGTGNFTGTATLAFSIGKKSVTGTDQTLLVKTGSAKDISYDLSKLLPAGVTGTTTYAVGAVSNENGVLSPVPADTDITDGKLTLHVASVATANQTATVQIAFTNNNYDISTATLTIKTTDKLPVTLKEGSFVTLQNSTLTYGQALSTLTFNSAVFVDDEDNVVTGTLAWKTPDATPNAGTTRATWVFTPNDESYATVEDTVAITVNKAAPNVTALPTVTERTYHPTASLMNADLVGGTVSGIGGNPLGGSWSWQTAGIIPTANNTGYVAVFTPTDTANYNTVTRTITVAVSKVTPYIATAPTAAAITYGATLDASRLSGGTVQYSDGDPTAVSGSFAWADATTKPNVADSNSTTYRVVFNPSDAENYNTAETDITLTVGKADNAPNMPSATMNVAYSCKKVSDVTLPTGWVWQDADKDTALAVDTPVTATAVYNGADKGNFVNETVSITITRSACNHANTEVRNAKAATCTETGYTGDTYCTDCGALLTTGTIIPLADHQGGTATCTKKAVCTVCGKEYGTLDANNHVHTEIRGAVAATCTAGGYTGDTYCTDCGVKTKTGTVTSALGHNYTGKVTTEPTTEKEGVRTYTCDRCGHSYTESIPKLPEQSHAHFHIGTVTKGATCIENGVVIYSCSCGDSYTEFIPALGHHYVSRVTKQPTTGSEGVMTYTCDRCGHSFTRAIAKLQNTNSTKPTSNKPASSNTANSNPEGNNSGDNNSEENNPEDNKPDTGKPYIKDENGKEGWDVIKDEVDKTKDGDIVTVEMNGTSVVPGDVLDDIKGKDVTIVFDMGGGITWSVNGKSITADRVGDIDFTVKADTNTIPVDIINNVTGERYSKQISLSYDGEFGFTAVLSVNMDSGNAGLYANLFYYNENTGEMEFICYDEIAEDGTAELTFTHASDYAIIIDREPMGEIAQVDSPASESQDTETETTQPDAEANDDAWNPWWIIIIGIAVIVIGLGVFLVVKKKKSGAE